MKGRIGVMVLAVCVGLGGCAGLGSRDEWSDGYPDDVYGRGGWGDPLDPYGPYPPSYYGRYGYYGPYGPYGGLGYSGWWWPPVYPVYWVYSREEPASMDGAKDVAKPRRGRMLRLQERMLDLPEIRVPPLRTAPQPATGAGGWGRRPPPPPPALPPAPSGRVPQPVRLPPRAAPAPIAPPRVMVPPVRAPQPSAEPGPSERPPSRRIFRRSAPDE